MDEHGRLEAYMKEERRETACSKIRIEPRVILEIRRRIVQAKPTRTDA
jgi:hypothetical protein